MRSRLLFTFRAHVQNSPRTSIPISTKYPCSPHLPTPEGPNSSPHSPFSTEIPRLSIHFPRESLETYWSPRRSPISQRWGPHQLTGGTRETRSTRRTLSRGSWLARGPATLYFIIKGAAGGPAEGAEKSRSKKGNRGGQPKLAVYYFVCWQAGLLARPGANRRRAPMDAQVAGRPILLHRVENMLHRVSTSTSSWHRASPLCFPPWKPFTQPSLQLPSSTSPLPQGPLSHALSRASPPSVCLSVRLPGISPSTCVRPCTLACMRACLWVPAPRLCFARDTLSLLKGLHASLPLRFDLPVYLLHPPSSTFLFSPVFPPLPGFYGARSTPTVAHLFALIAGWTRVQEI